MKNFFQGLHGTVRKSTVRLNEETGHFSLPTFIHFAAGHSGTGALEIFCFEISNEKTIRAKE